MIKLRGSLFTQTMPDNLASQTETQAFAYALGRQIDKLLDYADAARVYAAIDTAPETLLDYLAVELRTPSYSETYSLEVKRVLVKNSLIFYAKMGTPYAVNEIINAIFGGGQIEEWYEYGGDPHHFSAYVGTGGAVGPNELDEFRRVLSSVKRRSSWLDNITTVTEMTAEPPVQIGAVMCGSIMETPLPPVFIQIPAMVYVGSAVCGTITETTLPKIEEV